MIRSIRAILFSVLALHAFANEIPTSSPASYSLTLASAASPTGGDASGRREGARGGRMRSFGAVLVFVGAGPGMRKQTLNVRPHPQLEEAENKNEGLMTPSSTLRCSTRSLAPAYHRLVRLRIGVRYCQRQSSPYPVARDLLGLDVARTHRLRLRSDRKGRTSVVCIESSPVSLVHSQDKHKKRRQASGRQRSENLAVGTSRTVGEEITNEKDQTYTNRSCVSAAGTRPLPSRRDDEPPHLQRPRNGVKGRQAWSHAFYILICAPPSRPFASDGAKGG
ncbi:hypothetical protein BDK51DRAFT_38004 [Blyttiomyces helicus]|uniref:Secreted protein n=1 Tax=Blyttiomyces helicus TaxID=388810 RepID=A0A4V1IPG5_9FUNG|nr:hypothetical protein BDK51DRAFT_38004 [Blyttiomyces helicus]|eukprot:RKO82977.1 hypothetical protein BDK51DRAFT_38004 [Blyttiomyces helicus]